MTKNIVKPAVIGFGSAYLLYKNIWVSLGFAMVFAVYGFFNKKRYEKDRQRKMQMCFLDFLICLEPLLGMSGTFAGTFAEAVDDYRRFHGEDELCKFLDSAVNDFRINTSTSNVLSKLAFGINLEDSDAFARSMAICEKTGGNPLEITGKTTELLVGRARILRDIHTSLSGRMFEQKVITLMPFMLLGILSSAAGSYLEPMYTTAAGRIVMSAAGFLFVLQWVIGKKIIDIEV